MSNKSDIFRPDSLSHWSVAEWRNLSHPLITGKDGKVTHDACNIRDIDYDKVQQAFIDH
jgi:hypothetical protein